MTPTPVTDVAPDAEALAGQVARFVARRMSSAPDRFGLSLSGGSTPKRIYELLGVGDLGVPLDWRKLHLFWGDERFVPMDHQDSNFRMAQEAFQGLLGADCPAAAPAFGCRSGR